MSVGYFLLILLAIWLIPKLVRGFLFVHRIKKQANAMYEHMYGARPDTQSQPRRNKAGWSTPTPKRKKIDPEVGEYVKFQEIEVSEESTLNSDTSGTSGEYRVEQQVTDAEWEDVK